MLIFNAYKICNFVFVILATAYFLAMFWMIASLDLQSEWRDNWTCGPSCVDPYNGKATFYTLEEHNFFTWLRACRGVCPNSKCQGTGCSLGAAGPT